MTGSFIPRETKSKKMKYVATCKQLYHRHATTALPARMEKKVRSYISREAGGSNETRKEERSAALCTRYTFTRERIEEPSVRRESSTKWTITPSTVQSDAEARDLWDRRNCAPRNWNEKNAKLFSLGGFTYF